MTYLTFRKINIYIVVIGFISNVVLLLLGYYTLALTVLTIPYYSAMIDSLWMYNQAIKIGERTHAKRTIIINIVVLLMGMLLRGKVSVMPLGEADGVIIDLADFIINWSCIACLTLSSFITFQATKKIVLEYLRNQNKD